MTTHVVNLSSPVELLVGPPTCAKDIAMKVVVIVRRTHNQVIDVLIIHGRGVIANPTKLSCVDLQIVVPLTNLQD